MTDEENIDSDTQCRAEFSLGAGAYTSFLFYYFFYSIDDGNNPWESMLGPLFFLSFVRSLSLSLALRQCRLFLNNMKSSISSLVSCLLRCPWLICSSDKKREL